MAKEGKHLCTFGVQRYPGICSTGRGILIVGGEGCGFLDSIGKSGVLYTMYRNSRYIIRYETCTTGRCIRAIQYCQVFGAVPPGRFSPVDVWHV